MQLGNRKQSTRKFPGGECPLRHFLVAELPRKRERLLVGIGRLVPGWNTSEEAIELPATIFPPLREGALAMNSE